MASNAASGSANPALGHVDHDEPHVKADNYLMLIVGMMLTSIMQVLDTTVANVALPHMQSALGTTTETVTWVLTSYIVASAIMLPLSGWISAQIGADRLFLYSIAGFVLTSMLCGMAQNIEQMVIFRALQGVTGAFFVPLSQSFLLDTTRPSRHGQIMALWGSVIVLGPILGPVIGGWLTENWNWRWVFYVNVPVGAVALAILMPNIPKVDIGTRRFDMFGFVLIAIALSALQLLLDRGHQIDWFNSMEAWIYVFLIVSGTWVTVIHIITAPHPLFDRQLFLNVNLVVALVFMMMSGAILYATTALLPPLLQNLYGYDTIHTGLLLGARGFGFLLTTRLLAILTRMKIDVRIAVAIGFLGLTLSGEMMASWSLAVSQSTIFWAGFVQGFGMGLVFIPLNTFAFATLSPYLRTDGASLLSLFRTTGSSIGISIMASLYARNLQISHSDLTGQLQSNMTGVIDVSTIDRFQMIGDSVLRIVDAEINRQAAMIAYLDDFHLMAWMTLAAMPLILLLRKPSRAKARAAGG